MKEPTGEIARDDKTNLCIQLSSKLELPSPLARFMRLFRPGSLTWLACLLARSANYLSSVQCGERAGQQVTHKTCSRAPLKSDWPTQERALYLSLYRRLACSLENSARFWSDFSETRLKLSDHKSAVAERSCGANGLASGSSQQVALHLDS